MSGGKKPRWQCDTAEEECSRFELSSEFPNVSGAHTIEYVTSHDVGTSNSPDHNYVADIECHSLSVISMPLHTGATAVILNERDDLASNYVYPEIESTETCYIPETVGRTLEVTNAINLETFTHHMIHPLTQTSPSRKEMEHPEAPAVISDDLSRHDSASDSPEEPSYISGDDIDIEMTANDSMSFDNQLVNPTLDLEHSATENEWVLPDASASIAAAILSESVNWELPEEREQDVWFDAADDLTFSSTVQEDNIETLEPEQLQNYEASSPTDNPLYPGALISESESAAAILTFALNSEMSGQDLARVLKLIKLHLPKENNFWSTTYQFHKQFEDIKTPMNFIFP
ncbi:uncharacterized protein LOC127750546 isoform X1 [Frankliniella occidentalis]|uniref:Uncharacterized protein LOC127750546 isoform X1 n=1 Tax=Frankliniella occidentalis TaxID=133901 RepID=A0A9C6XRH8_FRAOC|nr:uncharacterized protein LOC127750546 isoform X1 [Frankliniella occidentalis]